MALLLLLLRVPPSSSGLKGAALWVGQSMVKALVVVENQRYPCATMEAKEANA